MDGAGPPPGPDAEGGPRHGTAGRSERRPIYLRTLCFVTDADRVLLLRRRKPPNEGLYNAPGGKIEADEDPYEACLRELHEETGLRVRALRLRAILTVVTRSTGAQWLLFVFVAERPDGPADAIVTDEGDLRWIPISEIAGVPVPSDIPLIAPYLFGPQTGILMGKIDCDNDDADSMLGHEFRTA